MNAIKVVICSFSHRVVAVLEGDEMRMKEQMEESRRTSGDGNGFVACLEFDGLEVGETR